MEKLNPVIEQTPNPSSKQLARQCQATNSQEIWSRLSRLTAELVAHGSLKEGNDELLQKQKLLAEKLADKKPEHVALAIKLHQEGTDDRPGKPWFPHISDLMVHIHPLERAERNRAAAEAARSKAWYSGKDQTEFVEDPAHIRAAAVADWKENQKPELMAKAKLADNELLTPAEKAAREAMAARRQAWQDPANDDPKSIERLKKSLQNRPGACAATV